MKASRASTTAQEVNFDGLVGPTHNYAGLSHGNLASQANRRLPANPRQAALQGLEKMHYLWSRGLPQALFPPQVRPDIAWLRGLGFTGQDAAVLEKASKADQVLLAAAWSASAMWVANAATISPSVDSGDGKVHITPANLASQLHRSLETVQTADLLKRIFPGSRFAHHEPLPAGRHFGDEGAANHIRLAPQYGEAGVEVFVYGYQATGGGGKVTGRFRPRQSLEASAAVARLHGLDAARTVFAEQNPAAIDAGVFHNDVISVGNADLFFCHAGAFLDQDRVLGEIKRKYAALGKGKLRVIEVDASEVSLRTAVTTYLFNSQILSLPDGGMLLLAAEECRRHPQTRKYLDALPAKGLGITEVAFADLRQSMRNGGGPACLRLRVVLTGTQWAAVPEGVKFSPSLYQKLRDLVSRRYRDRLLPADLADPELRRESRVISRELAQVLALPTV